MQGRQGAGRVQGQGTEGRAGLQDSILRFSKPENLKNHVFATLGEERGREGRAGFGFRAFRPRPGPREGQGAGQGAGRVQGQGTEGRAGLQDSILWFSRPENLKNHVFCNFLRRKGKGGAGFGFRAFRGRAAQGQGQGQGRVQGRQGAGRVQGQGRVARFHFEVFKA